MWKTAAFLLIGFTVLRSEAGTDLTSKLNDQAKQVGNELRQKIMPYWLKTSLDSSNGGFVLADNGHNTAKPATDKMIVTQSRMVWGFSHAHLKGLEEGRRNYLDAAAQGCEFLRKHFRDPRDGGYYWTTDLQGNSINRHKIVYGQSFVIYGLVEYFRASSNKLALDEALELYRTLQAHAHDAKHGGWMEHFTADWKPTLSPGNDAMVEVPGLKSANTHLHLMEAFTELYAATRDPAVRESLEEALDLNMKYFYPRVPGRSAFHRKPDWSAVDSPSSAGVSYGHNVEFAWLMIRGQQVLGRKPDWAHFRAHLDHALQYGYDHVRGGVYSLGLDDRQAHNTNKIWWVQAEMMAALTDSLRHKQNTGDAETLLSLLGFVKRYQVDPKDGIWYDTVTAEGQPKNTAKAHNWKGNYHDVRALVKFWEGFREP